MRTLLADRKLVLVFGAVVVLAAPLGWLIYTADVQHDQITALSVALAKQRQQAVQAGQTPVAPPPAQILATPTAVAGPKGDQGAAGPAGPAGRGLSSIVCISGVWHVAYTDGTVDGNAGVCAGPPGPIGLTGATGSPGPAGATGANGQNGATGAQGSQGDPGPTGPPGPAGSTGPAGASGANGKPPTSWAWTSPLGQKYVCTRDTGSPDSSPSYSCAAASSLP